MVRRSTEPSVLLLPKPDLSDIGSMFLKHLIRRKRADDVHQQF